MKVLIVHNSYRHAGGEDVVARQEAEILRAAGHSVVEYHRSNLELDSMTLLQRAAFPFRALWSMESHGQIQSLIRREKPDIAHVHNTLALVSASAYQAIAQTGTPLVQTLHNYRLLCPRADLFREIGVCESCMGRSVPWPAILHRCYHGNLAHSAGAAALLVFRRMMNVDRHVDTYIALTAFARQKLIQGGVPGAKIDLLPNCVCPDPGWEDNKDGYAVVASRFSPEKRILTVLEAWRHVRGVQLKLIGSGDAEGSLKAVAERLRLENVDFLGWRPRDEVVKILKRAAFLVFASEWYENFPMSICEAFACGVPVIASRLGAMTEIVEHGRTGLHFTPGDSRDLAEKIAWARDHPGQLRDMGRAARAEYESKYTSEQHLRGLMRIFEPAIARHRCSAGNGQ